MRIVFAGTPAAAVPSLRTLADSAHEVVGVVTRADAPIGRKRTLTPSPVATEAAARELPVLKTDRLDDAATATIREWQPDLGVIVAYGGLVREPLLSVPRHGWINLHFSLLPRWRGAAPVQHALIAGDPETGVAVFRLVPALDAGDVYAVERYPVPPEATAGTLLESLAATGADVVHRVADDIAQGTAVATPQHGEPTFAPKLTSADGRLDLTRPAGEVLARLRGTTPEPGAYVVVAGQRLKVLAARLAPATTPALRAGRIEAVDGRVLVGAADGALELLDVQPAGRTPMRAGDWWRGQRTAALDADLPSDPAGLGPDAGSEPRG